MKTLLSLLGGAVTITEANGVVSFNWNENLGGGAAAGILKGTGSITLSGSQALQLAEGWLNGKLPASLEPLAVSVEGIANAAVKSIE
jgi:hypothetical protein